MNRKVKQGFTLIELLVVVLIIGILAAVAVPQYQKAVEKARMSEALLTISSIQKGIDMWLLENGYPSDGKEVYFVGMGGYSNSIKGDLPIDVSASLNCYNPYEEDDPDGGNLECDSSGYTYEAYCWGEGCSITAFPITRRSEGGWTLSVSKGKDEDVWDKMYSDYEESSLSTSLLAGLESQGWRNEC